MISYQERLNSQIDAINSAVSASRADMWTALPGIIQSFNGEAVTAVVQPAITGVVLQPDGSNQAVKLPLLLDCPVVFPRGGGCTLTFPVKPGDECLVIFASRCIDAWWQSGGVQVPMEMRMHDLSDGFVLVGPMSQPNKINNISAESVQLRSDDGAAFFEINPSSHDIAITTSGNISISGKSIVMQADSVTIDTPITTISGGLQSGGSKGTGAEFRGDVIADGISLKNHIHGGVQSGGSNTTPPV